MKTSHLTPPTVRALARTAVATVCTSLAVQAAELKYSLEPEPENIQLGSAFQSLGDLDADGVPDFAVSDQSYKPAGATLSTGIVYVLSGADGSLIRTHMGDPTAFELFGFSLTALDANKDGVADLAVGATGANRVRIYSGADGALITDISGNPGSGFGASLANAGDQDDDGADDLFIGANFDNNRRGQVSCRSGLTGELLWTVDTEDPMGAFGSQIVSIDDLDADGRSDLAIATPGFRADDGNPLGKVSIHLSSDQSQSTELLGTGSAGRLGTRMTGIADANGDEIRDLLVGSNNGGTCLVLSGADLALIADLSIPTVKAFSPLVVGGSLEFDGDGVADWLIASPGMYTEGTAAIGGVQVISGADQSILLELISETPQSGLGERLAVLPGLGFAIAEISPLAAVMPGTSLAYIWEVEQFEPETEEPADSDGDGVADDIDVVIDSIMDATVLLFGIDTGVENRVDEEGRTIADHFAGLQQSQRRRASGRSLIRVIRVVSGLYSEKQISRTEAWQLYRGAIRGIWKARRR